MRIIASIYLAIALADFGFWLANGLRDDIFTTPYYYLTLCLYFFSLLSLFGFIMGKLFLSQRIWRGAFVLYLTTRTYELITRGLPLGGETFGTDLDIIFSYLWLVLPAGLAMWYLGFVRSNLRSGMIGQQAQVVFVPRDKPAQVTL